MGRTRGVDAHVTDRPRPCLDVAKSSSSALKGSDTDLHPSAITSWKFRVDWRGTAVSGQRNCDRYWGL